MTQQLYQKLDYAIEAATSAQIEKANGFLRVKDKDTNEAKFISQQTVGDYGTFTQCLMELGIEVASK